MALHASRRHVLMAGMCIVLLFVVEVEVAAVGRIGRFGIAIVAV